MVLGRPENLYLVPISFCMLTIPRTFVETKKLWFPISFYQRASRFVGALLLWPCLHKKEIAKIKYGGSVLSPSFASDFKSNPLAIRNHSNPNHCVLSCDFDPLFHRSRGDSGCDFAGALWFQIAAIGNRCNYDLQFGHLRLCGLNLINL